MLSKHWFIMQFKEDVNVSRSKGNIDILECFLKKIIILKTLKFNLETPIQYIRTTYSFNQSQVCKFLMIISEKKEFVKVCQCYQMLLYNRSKYVRK